MPDRWYAGNAEDERHDYRGWMIGHFIDSERSPRATQDVEVKWGNHTAGETRVEWTAGEERTTLLILIAGKFRLDLPDDSVHLTRQGDYVIWGPGLEHSWQAETDAVVITVRWPSVP